MTEKSKVVFNKNIFFSKIAHEFRAPLHGIIGIANDLYDNWETTSDDLKKIYINEFLKASKSLKNLTEQFLQLQKQYSGNINYKLEKINIAKVTMEALDIGHMLLFKKPAINLSLDCKTSKTEIIADRLWIHQLLVNLIQNAIKHAEAKNITVRIDLQQIADRRQLVISIIDDGVGIPENELNLIFDPFIQGSVSNKFPRDGFGLGLTICKEIVTAHGGRIWAENNNGGGAKISFTLAGN